MIAIGKSTSQKSQQTLVQNKKLVTKKWIKFEYKQLFFSWWLIVSNFHYLIDWIT